MGQNIHANGRDAELDDEVRVEQGVDRYAAGRRAAEEIDRALMKRSALAWVGATNRSKSFVARGRA